MPCQKLVTAKRLASAFVAELLDERSARERALDQHFGRESRRDRFGDALHDRAIGEERERAPAGGGDESDQLFDDRGFGVGVVATGEVVGHVEQARDPW